MLVIYYKNLLKEHWAIQFFSILLFLVVFEHTEERVKIKATSNLFFFQFYLFFYFTILYWFCHTLTWICHGCTCVPHPELPSHLSPHPIPLGHPSAPAPSILYHASNLDWRFVSYMIIYRFQCHSPISSLPHPLPQSPKRLFDTSVSLLLSCIHGYLFLNSIYMH